MILCSSHNMLSNLSSMNSYLTQDSNYHGCLYTGVEGVKTWL